jgi:hypothetical protein
MPKFHGRDPSLKSNKPQAEIKAFGFQFNQEARTGGTNSRTTLYREAPAHYN